MSVSSVCLPPNKMRGTFDTPALFDPFIIHDMVDDDKSTTMTTNSTIVDKIEEKNEEKEVKDENEENGGGGEENNKETSKAEGKLVVLPDYEVDVDAPEGTKLFFANVRSAKCWQTLYADYEKRFGEKVRSFGSV